jgi:hypothetical protein
MQSKLQSLYETCINVLIGFVISFWLNLVILPAFGHGHPSLLNNLGMTAVFTVASILRGYVIRRYFNAKISRMAERWAK